jgi:hypothetical protein
MPTFMQFAYDILKLVSLLKNTVFLYVKIAMGVTSSNLVVLKFCWKEGEDYHCLKTNSKIQKFLLSFSVCV